MYIDDVLFSVLKVISWDCLIEYVNKKMYGTFIDDMGDVINEA